jgi:hypothetical protein
MVKSMMRRYRSRRLGCRTSVTLVVLVLAAATPATGQVATISIVDTAGDVGRGSALAYGPDGRALISYLDATHGALKVAHCNDVACTTAVTNTIDGSGQVTGHTSIAFGPDGHGLISYQAGASIKVAHCADTLCASATISPVDTPAALRPGTAIVVGSDGLAIVAYGDPSGDALKMAHCLDADCGSAAVTPFPGRSGYNPTLTIGGDGLPLVACDNGTDDVHVGHCADAACTGATFVTIFGTPFPLFTQNFRPSLATRSDGLGLLAHIRYSVEIVGAFFDTRVVRCTNPGCSGLTQVPPFIGNNDNEFEAALALMPGDLPVIAQYAEIAGFPPPGNRLLVTRCPDAACLPAQYDVIDAQDSGREPAVAVSPAGIGLVSHYDGVNRDLKTAYLDGGGEISIGDVAVVEGDSGTTAAVFEVHQTHLGSASVDYATGGGTATAGVDYVATSGTVIFPPGTTTQTITVQVIGDLMFEPDETFFVTLSNPQGAVIGDGVGQGTIVDDDVAPLPVVTELAQGSVYAGDLAADPGPSVNVDRFRMAQAPYSSYEVVADALSGDIQPFELTRTSGDGSTVLQTATPVGVGFSVSLRWLTSSTPVVNQFVRVRSGGCGTDCGSDDVYRLRAYDTTLMGARFNNSGTQTTVLLLQNPTDAPVDAAIHFWATDGTLLATHVLSPPLAPKALLALNTAAIPGLANVGGTLTVAHAAPYGGLSGKTVALEPSTGFSFDTPLLPKPR